MLVEDEPPDAYLLMRGFEEWETPNEVSHFFNGQAALDHLRSTQPNKLPHLIICDIFMPFMGGKDFLREVKKDALLRHIRVVMLSSSALNRDKADTWQSQAYIVKDLANMMELNFQLLKFVETFWGREGAHSYIDYTLIQSNHS